MYLNVMTTIFFFEIYPTQNDGNHEIQNCMIITAIFYGLCVQHVFIHSLDEINFSIRKIDMHIQHAGFSIANHVDCMTESVF